MEHTKISCQVKSSSIFFSCPLDAAMFLKQLNDGDNSFKLMKINISSIRLAVLFCSFCVEQL